jgi:thymidylate kinase
LERGSFIVVEGLDNVGKTTFIDYFCKQNPLVSRRKFPSKHVSEMMNRIQFSKIDWNEFHDMFHDDLQIGIDSIQEELKAGISVICDRFYYSHWVYENLRRNEEYICLFHIPIQPDVIVYLRPDNPEMLDNTDKDNLERGLDYVRGQAEYDKMFSKRQDVITVTALRPETNYETATAIVDQLGVFL